MNFTQILFLIFLSVILSSCAKLNVNLSSPLDNISEEEVPVEELAVLEENEGEYQEESELLPKEMLDDTSDLDLTQEEKEELEIAVSETSLYDLPLVMNQKVEHMIGYFQTSCNKTFALWLARSGKYIPVMRQILKEYGLPQDLVYVAFIESGFNPRAYSRSHASGIWQFISSTGRRYGLRSNWWHDERRDPILATHAAAKYFKDLYDEFGDWYLAMAAYNAGEGKIARAIKRYNTRDYWELSKYRYLKQETKQYVPKVLAAMIIAKDPAKYGFGDVEYHEPLAYDEVKVPECTDIRQIAKFIGVSYKELKAFNPSLRRWCTPPNLNSYPIKLPPGKGPLLASRLDDLKKAPKVVFKRHYVRKGETLSSLSKRYKTSVWAIMDINHIKSARRLRAGKVILIPIPNYPMSQKSLASAISKTPAYKSKVSRNRHVNYERSYKVRKGDNLWTIANRYQVSVAALMASNTLTSTLLRPGQVLKIPQKGVNFNKQSSKIAYASPKLSQKKVLSGGESSSDHLVYKVRRGDTLWGIAQQYGVTVSDLREWNSLKSRGKIYPGDMLTLRLLF